MSYISADEIIMRSTPVWLNTLPAAPAVPASPAPLSTSPARQLPSPIDDWGEKNKEQRGL